MSDNINSQAQAAAPVANANSSVASSDSKDDSNDLFSVSGIWKQQKKEVIAFAAYAVYVLLLSVATVAVITFMGKTVSSLVETASAMVSLPAFNFLLAMGAFAFLAAGVGLALGLPISTLVDRKLQIDKREEAQKSKVAQKEINSRNLVQHIAFAVVFVVASLASAAYLISLCSQLRGISNVWNAISSNRYSAAFIAVVTASFLVSVALPSLVSVAVNYFRGSEKAQQPATAQQTTASQQPAVANQNPQPANQQAVKQQNNDKNANNGDVAKLQKGFAQMQKDLDALKSCNKSEFDAQTRVQQTSDVMRACVENFNSEKLDGCFVKSANGAILSSRYDVFLGNLVGSMTKDRSEIISSSKPADELNYLSHFSSLAEARSYAESALGKDQGFQSTKEIERLITDAGKEELGDRPFYNTKPELHDENLKILQSVSNNLVKSAKFDSILAPPVCLQESPVQFRIRSNAAFTVNHENALKMFAEELEKSRQDTLSLLKKYESSPGSRDEKYLAILSGLFSSSFKEALSEGLESGDRIVFLKHILSLQSKIHSITLDQINGDSIDANDFVLHQAKELCRHFILPGDKDKKITEDCLLDIKFRISQLSSQVFYKHLKGQGFDLGNLSKESGLLEPELHSSDDPAKRLKFANLVFLSNMIRKNTQFFADNAKNCCVKRILRSDEISFMEEVVDILSTLDGFCITTDKWLKVRGLTLDGNTISPQEQLVAIDQVVTEINSAVESRKLDTLSPIQREVIFSGALDSVFYVLKCVKQEIEAGINDAKPYEGFEEEISSSISHAMKGRIKEIQSLEAKEKEENKNNKSMSEAQNVDVNVWKSLNQKRLCEFGVAHSKLMKDSLSLLKKVASFEEKLGKSWLECNFFGLEKDIEGRVLSHVTLNALSRAYAKRFPFSDVNLGKNIENAQESLSQELGLSHNALIRFDNIADLLNKRHTEEQNLSFVVELLRHDLLEIMQNLSPPPASCCKSGSLDAYEKELNQKCQYFQKLFGFCSDLDLLASVGEKLDVGFEAEDLFHCDFKLEKCSEFLAAHDDLPLNSDAQLPIIPLLLKEFLTNSSEKVADFVLHCIRSKKTHESSAAASKALKKLKEELKEGKCFLTSKGKKDNLEECALILADKMCCILAINNIDKLKPEFSFSDVMSFAKIIFQVQRNELNSRGGGVSQVENSEVLKQCLKFVSEEIFVEDNPDLYRAPFFVMLRYLKQENINLNDLLKRDLKSLFSTLSEYLSDEKFVFSMNPAYETKLLLSGHANTVASPSYLPNDKNYSFNNVLRGDFSQENLVDLIGRFDVFLNIFSQRESSSVFFDTLSQDLQNCVHAGILDEFVCNFPSKLETLAEFYPNYTESCCSPLDYFRECIKEQEIALSEFAVKICREKLDEQCFTKILADGRGENRKKIEQLLSKAVSCSRLLKNLLSPPKENIDELESSLKTNLKEFYVVFNDLSQSLPLVFPSNLKLPVDGFVSRDLNCSKQFGPLKMEHISCSRYAVALFKLAVDNGLDKNSFLNQIKEKRISCLNNIITRFFSSRVIEKESQEIQDLVKNYRSVLLRYFTLLEDFYDSIMSQTKEGNDEFLFGELSKTYSNLCDTHLQLSKQLKSKQFYVNLLKRLESNICNDLSMGSDLQDIVTVPCKLAINNCVAPTDDPSGIVRQAHANVHNLAADHGKFPMM